MNEAPSKARIIKLLLAVTLPLYILDQITKWWVVFNFKVPYVYEYEGKLYGFEDTRPVIEGFFNLVRRHNQGVAFGIGNGTTWAPIVFLFVLVIALVAISYFWKKGAFSGPARWAPPLLLAGVVGNLTDRLLQGFWLAAHKDAGFWDRLIQGYVVDFLDFTIPVINYRWPAFNVADSCITISAVLLFFTAILEGKKEMAEAKKKKESR